MFGTEAHYPKEQTSDEGRLVGAFRIAFPDDVDNNPYGLRMVKSREPAVGN
jgi:hypothetical protein